MRRLGRPKGHAPAVQPAPQVCGRCGTRCATPRDLDAHAATCWTPQAREVGAVRMLSNAMLSLADRLPAKEATAVTYHIQRAAIGTTPEQRARLAWLVDEVSDAVDAVARRAARAALAAVDQLARGATS